MGKDLNVDLIELTNDTPLTVTSNTFSTSILQHRDLVADLDTYSSNSLSNDVASETNLWKESQVSLFNQLSNKSTTYSDETFIRDSYEQNDILRSRSVILNEKFDNIINIQSIVVSFNKEIVQCECLINKEEKLFETRSFPAIVFDNIQNLTQNKPVLISIKSKAGSIRIDVYDGKNYINRELFENNRKWDDLEVKFKQASIKSYKPKNA